MSTPTRPASSGNVFWKLMRIVGTSAMQTVVAAPNVKGGGVVDEVGGSVDDVVLDGVVVAVVVVDEGTDELVVVGATDVDVVGLLVDVVAPVVVVTPCVFGVQSGHVVVAAFNAEGVDLFEVELAVWADAD